MKNGLHRLCILNNFATMLKCNGHEFNCKVLLLTSVFAFHLVPNSEGESWLIIIIRVSKEETVVYKLTAQVFNIFVCSKCSKIEMTSGAVPTYLNLWQIFNISLLQFWLQNCIINLFSIKPAHDSCCQLMYLTVAWYLL